jgi:peptide chain release factor 1
MQKIAEDIIAKGEFISNQLLSPDIEVSNMTKLSKELSDIDEILSLSKEYKVALNAINDLDEIISANEDPEFVKMAQDELVFMKEKIPGLEKAMKLAMIPKDNDDKKNVIVEIRAGTGGDEAALFASVLYKMYTRYAEKKGWTRELISVSENELGGIRDISFTIKGSGVFGKMKFESGTHRVQRVPETEQNGRIHTSAATVAILPEVDDITVKIEEKDIRTDVFRSSGPGGQSVNTTDSGVRITHLPTGIVVQQQDEKSQIKNREKAMKILRARIYDHFKSQADMERSKDRKSQIGSGDRSEKIRTYNYPQSRITDHRINLTVYKFDQMLDGDLDEMIESLQAAEEVEKLSSFDI